MYVPGFTQLHVPDIYFAVGFAFVKFSSQEGTKDPSEMLEIFYKQSIQWLNRCDQIKFSHLYTEDLPITRFCRLRLIKVFYFFIFYFSLKSFKARNRTRVKVSCFCLRRDDVTVHTFFFCTFIKKHWTTCKILIQIQRVERERERERAITNK